MDLDSTIPKVRADAEQLRQVLINLIRNAVQAMGTSGAVYVSTRARVERHPAGGSEASWVEIAVRDEGPGIAPQVMKNLFVPFVTTKERGTGLGLAISQRVVAEMGGRIDAVSRPGLGSTFTVLLPVATDAAKEAPSEPSTTAEPSARGRRAGRGTNRIVRKRGRTLKNPEKTREDFSVRMALSTMAMARKTEKPGEPRRLALKFISGKYQGGEFPLNEGQDVVVGRSSELDMVLVEEMVSRKHAVFRFENSVLTVQDLGSTNGTFVNGERIEKAMLA